MPLVCGEAPEEVKGFHSPFRSIQILRCGGIMIGEPEGAVLYASKK
jgi:hypothetical protein